MKENFNQMNLKEEQTLMDIDNLNNSENKNSVIFDPYFLQIQIHLPSDQWDERFRELIEKLIKERQNQEHQNNKLEEKSPEALRESTFRRYLKGLGLSEEELKDKRVLDLGCGEHGEFIRYLIENGITQKAYGIDLRFDESSVKDELKSHFFKTNFEEIFPVGNLDYIISVGAVSNGIWAGEEVMNISRIIENSLNALKEGGVILIYPIQESAKATPLSGLLASKQKWDELIKKISQKHNVECEIKPRNIKVIGKNNDIILESVLIIRKSKAS